MREMKDSETQWLKEIPADWTISKIGQLYRLRNTKVSDKDYPPLSVTNKGIVPQLDTAAKTNAHDDRKLVKKGDFAINSRSDRRGSCGISAYDGSVSLINTILAPLGEMNPAYYDWLFHTVQFGDEFYKWGHGIVDDLWTTGWQEMKKISIPTPPLSEQQRIADFLDGKCAEIDGLVADIQSQIDTLEQYKRSVITETVTKGLNPDAEIKDSGIEWVGMIPAHWKVLRIKNMFSIVSGATPSPDIQNWDGDIRWITPADYKTRDKYVAQGKRNLSSEGFNTCSTSIIPRGSIIFSKRAPIGTVAINTEELCTNQGCLSCIPITDCSCEFFYYVMSIGTEHFELLGTGTTFKEISASNFANCKLPTPPFSEQVGIAHYLSEKVSEIDTIIDQKKEQLTVLENYKKSLIYEYVTGKKEVPVQ